MDIYSRENLHYDVQKILKEESHSALKNSLNHKSLFHFYGSTHHLICAGLPNC